MELLKMETLSIQLLEFRPNLIKPLTGLTYWFKYVEISNVILFNSLIM